MHNMLQQCYFEAYFHLPSQSFTFVSFFGKSLHCVAQELKAKLQFELWLASLVES